MWELCAGPVGTSVRASALRVPRRAPRLVQLSQHRIAPPVVVGPCDRTLDLSTARNRCCEEIHAIDPWLSTANFACDVDAARAFLKAKEAAMVERRKSQDSGERHRTVAVGMGTWRLRSARSRRQPSTEQDNHWVFTSLNDTLMATQK
ncbi:hypothetical protein BP5796_05499 [Coleophoma crateriformis]|uniref:Uncharacterized protein n=1 Tax=Coleophoma crateriformis TaxID=565419 RepID=A0A3D8S3X7_9HELO|nr:hypothetical protein BP5796_05499 [Coleophoma crateriformis]